MPTPDPRQTTLDLPAGDGAATPDPPTPAEGRPGFREVKRIGWIPEDWDVKPLNQIGDVVTGTTPSTSEDSYYGGEYPFVSPGDLGEHRDVYYTEKTLTKEGFAQTRHVPEGSVLFTCISFAIGKTALAGQLLATNQQINSVIPRERQDGKYLYYYLDFMADRIKRLAGLQATPILNKTDFSRVEVSYPPTGERRKIARILGAWDDALAQLDTLIAAKEERLKGLAQRLLTGEERLPGFTEEWKPQQLGRYFSHFSKRNRDGEDLTVLSCSKVHGIIPQAELFDKRIASDDTSNYKVVEHGDLVYDPMLLWDASIGFVEAVTRGVISPAYASFRLKEKVADRSFFKHFFDGHFMRHQYKVISQGTNRRRRKAMASDFLKIEAPMPEKKEQTAIATVLDTAEAEVDLLRQERDALAQQKKGLMQRLLTGEVRVTPDPEDFA